MSNLLETFLPKKEFRVYDDETYYSLLYSAIIALNKIAKNSYLKSKFFTFLNKHTALLDIWDEEEFFDVGGLFECLVFSLFPMSQCHHITNVDNKEDFYIEEYGDYFPYFYYSIKSIELNTFFAFKYLNSIYNNELKNLDKKIYRTLSSLSNFNNSEFTNCEYSFLCPPKYKIIGINTGISFIFGYSNFGFIPVLYNWICFFDSILDCIKTGMTVMPDYKERLPKSLRMEVL